MAEPLLSSHKLTIGAQHRDKILDRLIELGIPFEEVRGLSVSVITIRLSSEEHNASYLTLRRELMVFPKTLEEIDNNQS